MVTPDLVIVLSALLVVVLAGMGTLVHPEICYADTVIYWRGIVFFTIDLWQCAFSDVLP
jgi:hypothetical protein